MPLRRASANISSGSRLPSTGMCSSLLGSWAIRGSVSCFGSGDVPSDWPFSFGLEAEFVVGTLGGSLPRLRGRDREGRKGRFVPPAPSPPLPRKRGREQTEFASRRSDFTRIHSPSPFHTAVFVPAARFRARVFASRCFTHPDEGV